MSQSFSPADPGTVRTIHILKDGTFVSSVEDFQAVQERFAWVNKADMIRRILHLRTVTDESKKSVIAIYEEGQIKEFHNVDQWFRPLSFC